MTQSGWDASAEAWIGHLGNNGDRTRRYVIDPTLRAWLDDRAFTAVLDVGYGEGRLCRMLAGRGVSATGIDPTQALIAHAKSLDPDGSYDVGMAEALPYDDGQFDLVITCLSLIDIPDFRAAISQMSRVLAPGGHLIAVNLTSFNSAGDGKGWKRGGLGVYKHFALDNYLEERTNKVSFAGVNIINWHRPLSAYMQAYLSAGLQLVRFDEPACTDSPEGFAQRYNRAPWLNFMEWRKPA